MDEKLFAACQYTERGLDWRGAIKLACRPLAQQGKISAGYADAIISATEKNGPWYILTPEFALPHARPDEGVLSPHSVLSLVAAPKPWRFPITPMYG